MYAHNKNQRERAMNLREQGDAQEIGEKRKRVRNHVNIISKSKKSKTTKRFNIKKRDINSLS